MGLGGGILGAIIGGILGGPWGAVIGGGMGYIMGGNASAPDRERVRQRSEAAMALLFQILGKLAKADGRVSQEEANFVRQLMTSMRLPADMRQKMKEQFNFGRDTEGFAETVRRLDRELTVNGTPVIVRQDIVNIFCALVAVDRVVSPAERQMLQEAGSILGVPYVVENFFARTASSGTDAGRRRREEYTSAECCRILGVAENASAFEVKKAWRKKVKEYHPDRMQGNGMSAEVIDRAKEEVQKINKAYETLCSLNGW